MQTIDNSPQSSSTAEIADKLSVSKEGSACKFTGDEKHFISLVEASVVTRRHREKSGRGSVIGGFFGRLIYEKILGQDGCVGIRSYYAALNDGTPTLVLVGVDETGEDMVRGVLGDDAFPSPPFSGAYNLLNSDLEDYLIPRMKREVVFTGMENHCITLAEARHFVNNFRKDREDRAVKEGYFSREFCEKVLSQVGNVGFRYYFGENGDGTPRIILVGVDDKGNDQLSGVIGEDLLKRPSFCSDDSTL